MSVAPDPQSATIPGTSVPMRHSKWVVVLHRGNGQRTRCMFGSLSSLVAWSALTLPQDDWPVEIYRNDVLIFEGYWHDA